MFRTAIDACSWWQRRHNISDIESSAAFIVRCNGHIRVNISSIGSTASLTVQRALKYIK